MSTNTTSGPSTPAILPGAGETTLGVVGGGQLGRMFVHAAQSMGYFTAVLAGYAYLWLVWGKA